MRNRLFILLITAVSLFFFASNVKAEEIIISDNGSGTANQVNAITQTTTQVTQENTSQVTNDIKTDVNTGNSTTNLNSNGDTTLSSGSVTINNSIENNGNTNVVANSCCQPTNTSTTNINGNGSGSSNSVSIDQTNVTTINTVNTAIITNRITGTINTGNNHSDFNKGGDITISTGNIEVASVIKNSPINTNLIDFSTTNGFVDTKTVINGNGAYSTNSILSKNNSSKDINTINNATILNDVLWLLNTGNNYANNNTDSNILIDTGNIIAFTLIDNGPINTNWIKLGCECKQEENKPKPPTGGITPPNQPSSSRTEESKPSGSGSSGNGKGGEVLGTAIREILPATGNYDLLLFLIGNVMMFLIGVVLRLRSGRSPAVVLA